MKPMQVAILAGGPSAERGISLKSAAYIKRFLDPDKYHCLTVDIRKDGWYCQEERGKIDLNNFSLPTQNGAINFDYAFIIIHGTPAEDGKIQGYFETLGIPYSCCDTLCSALTFDKEKCKRFLSTYDIPMAEAVLLKRKLHALVDPADFRYPVFVKPNKNGSSYGITKVTEGIHLQKAVGKAFDFDDEVLVEQFLDGIEVSCGVLRTGDELHAFPLTEIVPNGDFFDYSAKYEGASEEITPARIDQGLTENCQALSRKIYGILACRGLIRIDYILVGNTFYLLEVNTIPGLSPTSIVPQQARALGWSDSELLENIINATSREPVHGSLPKV